jgi:exosortase
MSLLALGVALAFLTQKSTKKRLLLVVMTLPIAIFTNMLRVVGTGVLAHYYGAAAAEGFFHEFAGLAVFSLALLLLILVGMFLRRS